MIINPAWAIVVLAVLIVIFEICLRIQDNRK
jgi:hypothetical protein